MFIENTCDEFTQLLASTDAVPGGGGAAAFCGALGVSLCSMAACLTAGKKKFAEHRAELENIITKCDELRKDFMCLVDADAECFAPLAAAYSLPKDDPDYEKTLHAATLNAMSAPYAMAKNCCETIELIETLFDGRCSTLLISDAGCAAALCRAAMQCAAMNVFINTKALRGVAKAEAIHAHTQAMLTEYLPRADAISEKILLRLSEVK